MIAEPEGPWFECDRASYAARRATQAENGMSAEALALADQLQDQGLAVLDGLFEAPLIEAVQRDTRALSGRCVRAQDLWRVNASVRALATHPAITDLLSATYQRRAFAFQTLNFPVGTEQAPHSDAMHFSTEPFGFMCGVWVALEDVTPEQGALVYYPGSHHLTPVSRQALQQRGGAHQYPAMQAEQLQAAGLTPQTVSLKQGQVVIWAANLVHGGGAIANRDATRLSQVTHYYFEDCVYTTPIHTLDGPVFVRQPFDIAAGKMAQNRRHGRVVRPSFGAFRAAWTDLMLRRVHYFE